MKWSLLLFFIFCFFSITQLSAAEKIEYEKPKILDPITDIPRSMKEAWALSFNTKPNTLWAWGAITASSVVFYVYDEKIYKHAKVLGNKLGIGNDDKTKTLIHIGKLNIFRGPTDVGSAMYFIGDGWMQTGMAAAFYLNGKFSDDNRAMQTGSQIMNSLFSASIPVQLIKRGTGREDPGRATKYRGRWKPFSKNYDKDISAHDAVPSGHLMAASSTMTVIDSNYPEYRNIIRPVGFTLLTLLSFQMVNNGVHWISDYPLALGFGYVFGKAASTHGKKVNDKSASSWEFLPIYYSSHTGKSIGASALYDF